LSSCEKVISLLDLFVKENSASESGQQYDANKSVGSKESGVQATEIVGANKPMLVDKQRAGRNHAAKATGPSPVIQKPDKRQKCAA
jgi:hypothetical protein